LKWYIFVFVCSIYDSTSQDLQAQRSILTVGQFTIILLEAALFSRLSPYHDLEGSIPNS